MFGLMEQTAGFAWSPSVTSLQLAVVPTVVIPFAIVSALCSALATFIAGLFGLNLKWEGPKRLLEVLIKPRVIVTAVLLNAAFLGAWHTYKYVKNSPSFLRTVKSENSKLSGAAAFDSMRTYTEYTQRYNHFQESPDKPTKKIKAVSQQWVAKTSQGVFGAVTLSGESAFVGSDDGHVYEFERKDGALVRKFFIGTALTPQPVIWKGRLFQGEGLHDTINARIYSFDLKSGNFLGAYQTKGHTEGMPAIFEYLGQALMFVMAGADGIHAVDPLTLEKKWSMFPGHVDSEVRVVDGRVFFATGIEKGRDERTHRAYALDFFTGAVIWKVELSASGWMPPVVVGNEVCFGTGEIYVESHFGQFSCYDRATGTPKFSANLEAPLMGIPMLLGQKGIITADLQGQVCSITYPEGWRRWCMPSHGKKTYASAATDGRGHVLYPTHDDGIVVLDADTGALQLSWKPTEQEKPFGSIYSRVVVGDDGWYIADLDGHVRKIVPEYEP